MSKSDFFCAMDTAFSLKGKTILVTGASSGIGRACAICFAESGAKVLLSGRSEERLAEVQALCPGSVSLPGDLSASDGTAKLAASMESVDGFLHAVGVSRQMPIRFSTDEDLNFIMDANYFSGVRLTRDIMKLKKINKGGSVVYIASISGMLSCIGQFMYGSSKAAMIEFARDMAVEFAPRKIRANAISPGMVRTPMTEDFIKDSPDLYQADLKKYLLGYGDVSDVANAAQYLLSDASKWVTGTNLVVDGGYVCQK